jgi:hypothetical protein
MTEKLLVIGAGFLGNAIFQLATKTGLTALLNTSLSNKLVKSLITTEIIPLEKWLKEKFLNI